MPQCELCAPVLEGVPKCWSVCPNVVGCVPDLEGVPCVGACAEV